MKVARRRIYGGTRSQSFEEFSEKVIPERPVKVIPGVQTGGYAVDGSGTPDAGDFLEKTANVITGDRTYDKIGRPV